MPACVSGDGAIAGIAGESGGSVCSGCATSASPRLKSSPPSARPAAPTLRWSCQPAVSSTATSLFLDGFSRNLEPDIQAVLVLDQAGWHGSGALVVPDNVTLLPLPTLHSRSEPRGTRLAVPGRALPLPPALGRLRHRRPIPLRSPQRRGAYAPSPAIRCSRVSMLRLGGIIETLPVTGGNFGLTSVSYPIPLSGQVAGL